jgi:hypothetical protein
MGETKQEEAPIVRLASWTKIADHDPEREAFHSAHRELSTQERAFFEKLALLDGGIVGLVVSAVLGPLHGQIKHRYTLLSGLICLIFAMGFLLLRTYYSIKHQRGVIQQSYLPERHLPQEMLKDSLLETLNSFLGGFLTIVGISLLVVEVYWLLLT